MALNISAAQIDMLRAAGHPKLAKKLESSVPNWKDWTKLFFGNLWSVNKLKMTVGVPTTVTGAIAVGVGAVTVPVVGWVITGGIALGLLLLGVGLLLTSIDEARSLTSQLLKTTGSLPGDSAVFDGVPDNIETDVVL